MKIVSFSDLALIEPIQRAVSAENYTTPTPIQAQAIPHLLEGRDLLGCAQTGTGKTAAFALPMLQLLSVDRRPPRSRFPRALILTPTRELAAQICDSFGTYGKYLRLSRTMVFGGVGQWPQVQALSRGVDILVATPGRLLDLMNQGRLELSQIEIFVLDEADRMLDMGFLPDIHRVIDELPEKRQTLFFSATMPPAIASLAAGLLTDPVRVHVSPEQPDAERIEQKVVFVDKDKKPGLLGEMLSDDTIGRALVFTRTKHGADKVVKHLIREKISADCIHGNKSQAARTKALDRFRSGRLRVLVATDIAARGIDVDGITHVINYDLPVEPESYVHRIGRTARAGASGVAFSFCEPGERSCLRSIERLIRRPVPVAVRAGYEQDAREYARAEQARTGSSDPARENRNPAPGYARPEYPARGYARPDSRDGGRDNRRSARDYVARENPRAEGRDEDRGNREPVRENAPRDYKRTGTRQRSFRPGFGRSA